MHVVIVEDDKGDTIDIREYCTDTCAKNDPHYAGWNGAHEKPEYASICQYCASYISTGTGIERDDQTYTDVVDE